MLSASDSLGQPLSASDRLWLPLFDGPVGRPIGRPIGQVSILFVSFELGARSRKISHNILGAADKSVNALREMVDGAKVVKLQVRALIPSGCR